jgi:hypothetical protein
LTCTGTILILGACNNLLRLCPRKVTVEEKKLGDAIAAIAAWLERRFDKIEQRLDVLAEQAKADGHDNSYTIKDFAERAQVSEHTIARAISHGKLHAVNIGTRLTIPASEFNRVMREGLPDIPPGYKPKGNARSKGPKKKRSRKPRS